MEEFRKIIYAPGYEVSDLGRVRNSKTGRVLRTSATDKGYRKVALVVDGKQKYFRVHRLVAEAFVPNEDGKPQVDHIDEDKANNVVGNLRWCTGAENINYHYELNPHKKAKPKRSTMSREEMAKKYGKPITVDGQQFVSCGAAAQYIVEVNPGKHKATVSKELRRYLQGKRSEWIMYGKHTIGY